MRKKSQPAEGVPNQGSEETASNSDNNEEKQRIDSLLESLLKKPLVDFACARKDVHKLARGSVVEITKKIAAAAMAGNLLAAKYLFEMSGVYPVSEQGPGGIEEGSLAETLLKYLGLPTTLKPDDDDAAQLEKEETQTSHAGDSAAENGTPEADQDHELDHSNMPTVRSAEMKID